jgi:hypothetical protein
MNPSQKHKLNYLKNKQKKYQSEEKIDSCITFKAVCPDMIRVPLRYAQKNLFGGAVNGEQIYNLNSLFDPDRTGVGHQPLGMDQWAAFYNRYRVDEVEVDIDFINGAAAMTDCLVVASNDATAINTVATFESGAEAPYSWNRMCTLANSLGMLHFRRRFKINDITGVPLSKYKIDDTYQALVTSNPGELIVLHVVCQSNDFATNIGMDIRVRLTYYATFWDRKQLIES